MSGKRVLMRVDFNVPQDKATGAITHPAHCGGPADDQVRARARRVVVLMSTSAVPTAR